MDFAVKTPPKEAEKPKPSSMDSGCVIGEFSKKPLGNRHVFCTDSLNDGSTSRQYSVLPLKESKMTTLCTRSRLFMFLGFWTWAHLYWEHLRASTNMVQRVPSGR